MRCMSTGLRAYRESKGVSIRKMEKLTGINRGRLSIIEGASPPTPDELEAYFRALQEPVPDKVA